MLKLQKPTCKPSESNNLYFERSRPHEHALLKTGWSWDRHLWRTRWKSFFQSVWGRRRSWCRGMWIWLLMRRRLVLKWRVFQCRCRLWVWGNCPRRCQWFWLLRWTSSNICLCSSSVCPTRWGGTCRGNGCVENWFVLLCICRSNASRDRRLYSGISPWMAVWMDTN